MTDSIHLSRRALLALASASALTGALPAVAQQTEAEPLSEEAAEAAPIVVPRMAMGADDAPIVMYEYASFTCPHCKNFHNSVLPEIVTKYIETGKLQLVYRAVYFDRLGLWADLLAHCGGEERYFGIAKLLYEKQTEWTKGETAGDIVENLKGIGRQAGLSDEDMDACLRDNDFAKALVEEFQKNAEADGISATPTFVIDGELINNMPWEDFERELDGRLAALGVE